MITIHQKQSNGKYIECELDYPRVPHIALCTKADKSVAISAKGERHGWAMGSAPGGADMSAVNKAPPSEAKVEATQGLASSVASSVSAAKTDRDKGDLNKAEKARSGAANAEAKAESAERKADGGR